MAMLLRSASEALLRKRNQSQQKRSGKASGSRNPGAWAASASASPPQAQQARPPPPGTVGQPIDIYLDDRVLAKRGLPFLAQPKGSVPIEHQNSGIGVPEWTIPAIAAGASDSAQPRLAQQDSSWDSEEEDY